MQEESKGGTSVNTTYSQNFFVFGLLSEVEKEGVNAIISEKNITDITSSSSVNGTVIT